MEGEGKEGDVAKEERGRKEGGGGGGGGGRRGRGDVGAAGLGRGMWKRERSVQRISKCGV